MKIGVELEFFICHKSDETFYMPDIISRYLKYNSGFISMQKDSNGICIKAKNELGVTISFEFTVSDCSTTSCVFDFLLRCTPL